MAQAMNGLVDGVLQAVQERLAAMEMDLADVRGEMDAIRRDLDDLRMGGGGATRPPAAGLETRLARVERRLEATDVKPGIRLQGKFRG